MGIYAAPLSAAQQTALEAVLSAYGWDANNDGFSQLKLRSVSFTADYPDLDAIAQSNISTLIKQQDCALMVCNNTAAQYLSYTGNICLWSEIISGAPETPVCVPFSEIDTLQDFSSSEPLYLCLHAPSDEYSYTRQSDQLIPFFLTYQPAVQPL